MTISVRTGCPTSPGKHLCVTERPELTGSQQQAPGPAPEEALPGLNQRGGFLQLGYFVLCPSPWADKCNPTSAGMRTADCPPVPKQWETNGDFMQGFLCISVTITLNSLDPQPGS